MSLSSRHLFRPGRTNTVLPHCFPNFKTGSEKTGIFRCPAALNKPRSEFEALSEYLNHGRESYENDFYTEHYGYNVYGSWGKASAWAGGLGRDFLEVNNTLTRPVPEAGVKAPSDMMALADGFCTIYDGDSPSRNFINRSPMLSRDYFGFHFNGNETKRARKRHKDQANVVFCDSHVEGIKLNAIFLDTSDRALRRWNRDNEPHRIGAR